MELSVPILVLLFALLVTLGRVLCVAPLRSPLRTVRGPFFARFTDGWYFWQVWKGSFQHVNQGLHQKYGNEIQIDHQVKLTTSNR